MVETKIYNPYDCNLEQVWTYAYTGWRLRLYCLTCKYFALLANMAAKTWHKTAALSDDALFGKKWSALQKGKNSCLSYRRVHQWKYKFKSNSTSWWWSSWWKASIMHLSALAKLLPVLWKSSKWSDLELPLPLQLTIQCPGGWDWDLTSLHVVLGRPRLRFPWVGFHRYSILGALSLSMRNTCPNHLHFSLRFRGVGHGRMFLELRLLGH